MRNTYLAATITSVIGIAITLNGRSGMSKNDRMLGLGVLIIALIICFGIVAVVLSIFKKTRPLAKGVFLGMGIYLLIGFAICTV